MNDDFRVNEEGFTKDGYRILKKSSLRAMYLGNAIWFVILAIVCGLGVHELSVRGYQMAAAALIVVFIALAAYLIVSPRIFYDHYRYRLDDDKVEVRRGVIVIRHTLVPIERVHQVDVKKGPIKRMFGLADVYITTAGGTAAIEFLENDIAESIASKLNECVVKILKDRD